MDDPVCNEFCEFCETVLLMWVINVSEYGLFDVHISTALWTKFLNCFRLAPINSVKIHLVWSEAVGNLMITGWLRP